MVSRSLAVDESQRYSRAALTVTRSLLDKPYLSEDPNHEGLILHAIYNRPGGWDYMPPGRSIPCGESAMWGDYHGLELAVILWRELQRRPYLTFFSAATEARAQSSDAPQSRITLK